MKTITLYGTATLSKAAPGKVKKVYVVAYNGDVLDGVAGYGRVVVDLAGLELPATIPINLDHENSIRSLAGQGKPKISGGILTVTGTLANSEAGKLVMDLLQSGTQLQASIEVQPRTTTNLDPGETIEINWRKIEITAPTVLIDAGVLRAVALVQQGADTQTSARLAAKKTKGTSTMETTIEHLQAKYRNPDNAEKLWDPRVNAIFAAAFAGEATEHEVDAVLKMSHPRELHQPNTSARRGTAGEIDNQPHTGRESISASSLERAREVLAAAFLLHTGAEPTAVKAFGAPVMQAARELRVRHVMDLVEASVQLNPTMHGVPAEKSELLRAAFGPSTYSFPSALGLAGEKLMSETYQNTPASWRSWTGTKPVQSFREHTGIRPYLLGGGFDEVLPGGEIKHTAAGEETYTISADTYGKLFQIDRRDLVNDDLNMLVELFAEIGRQAPRKIADLLYTAILANAGSYFGTANANFDDGADTALTVASLGLAVALLRKQKDANGKPIALTPAVILVPPELETAAASIVNSTTMQRDTTVDMQSTGNPWAGRLAVEVEPRLSDSDFHASASTTAWYLLSGKATPTAIIAYLNGRENPVVEQIDAPANVLGVSLRGYIDFGVALSDHRAGVLMAGA